MLPGALASFCNAPAAGGGGYTATKCFEFNGTDEYVDLGAVSAMNGAVNDGTPRAISFWFKTTYAGFGGWLVSRITSPSTDRHWGAQLLFGQLAVWCGGGISYGPSGLNDGNWHHVLIAVRDVSGTPTLNVWVDNSLSINTTAIYAVTSTNDWFAAAAGDVTEHISGRITNLSLWSGANFDGTTAAELYNSAAPYDLTTHSLASGLVAWWKFGDDDTPTTATDSANANDGTMINMDGTDIITDAP